MSARNVQEEEVRSMWAAYSDRYFATKAAKSMTRVLSSVHVQFSNASPRAVTSLLQLNVASRLGLLDRRD